MVAIISKLRHIQSVLKKHGATTDEHERRKLAFHLQALGLANDEDRMFLKRNIDGWFVRKTYAVFLSHFKMEAAAEARILKSELVHQLKCSESEVYLDSDNLSDLSELIDSGVKESDAVILLLTKGVLSRPWCLLELHAAALADVPIIMVQVANSFAGDTEAVTANLLNLPDFLAENNPDAEAVLEEFGHSSETIAPVILKALEGSQEAKASVDIQFDPHQSSSLLNAQVTQMAEELVKRACPENAPLITSIMSMQTQTWDPVSHKYAVYIMHDQQSNSITQHAHDVKSWLISRTNLKAGQITISEDFNQNRDIVDVTDDDLNISQQTGVVLLFQTAKILHDPRCLAQLYMSASTQTPIVPVALSWNDPSVHDAYNFEEASEHLRSLHTHVSASTRDALENSISTSIETVGKALQIMLPNLISKPLSVDGSIAQRDAQLAQIETALRSATSSASLTRASSLIFKHRDHTPHVSDVEELVPDNARP